VELLTCGVVGLCSCVVMTLWS